MNANIQIFHNFTFSTSVYLYGLDALDLFMARWMEVPAYLRFVVALHSRYPRLILVSSKPNHKLHSLKISNTNPVTQTHTPVVYRFPLALIRPSVDVGRSR